MSKDPAEKYSYARDGSEDSKTLLHWTMGERELKNKV